MLSKKMAFSLTSLIIILALAFVVPAVVAQDLSTTLTVAGNDISHAEGQQRQLPDANGANSVTFNVVFEHVVAITPGAADTNGIENPASELFVPADLVVVAYNVLGASIPITAAETANIAVGSPANGMNYTITQLVPAATSTLFFQIPEGVVGAVDPTITGAENSNAAAAVEVNFLGADGSAAGPNVYSISRVGQPFTTVTSESFQVHVLLSEDSSADPTDLANEFVNVTNATVSSVVKLASPPAIPGDSGSPAHPAVDINGDGDTADTNGTTLGLTPPTLFNEAAVAAGTLPVTWRDGALHLYLVTIATQPGDHEVTIQVNDFPGMENPTPGMAQQMYIRAADPILPEGRQELTVMTSIPDPADPLTPGITVGIPENTIIPAGGYLVVAENLAGSAVLDPEPSDTDNNHLHTPANPPRPPYGVTYNRLQADGLPNLETFLTNGGTIDVVGPAGLIISEIMWGSDASLADSFQSQWIELQNTSGAAITAGADNQYRLVFYAAGTSLMDMSVAANNIQDRVGTVGAHGYWSIANKGQSGRTGVGEGMADVVPVIPTQALISMQRAVDATSATGLAMDGTDPMSWGASTPPGLNFNLGIEGERIGSPGRAPTAYPATPVPTPEPVAPTPVSAAMASDILISEIMVDTGDGRLPQWIELTNVSGAEKSLDGWSLMISNSAADADAVGSSVSINLSGTLGVGGGVNRGGDLGKALLLVAWDGRNSANLDGSERVIDVSSEVGQRGRYKLISDMAFMIALVPPQTTGVLQYGDMAGNLDAAEAWDIPMSENSRSSLIRKADAGTYMMGTEADGWMLASDTGLSKVSDFTWYGSDEDDSTPGVVGGGPLPVELSHFRPARDKATGAVVITWATQSELNNAGFFIKRSQQRNGEFKVVNTTMVAGAGTTSEKQFYTYTDTTAQPNVVYYYQIEDVSLDGNRQTLTRGIRLKGHVGAAGKATTLWGELKTSHE